MLHAAIPALRNASSKLDRRSRCFPTPLVRNIFCATNAIGRARLRFLHSKDSKNTCAEKLTSERNDVNRYSRYNDYILMTAFAGGISHERAWSRKMILASACDPEFLGPRLSRLRAMPQRGRSSNSHSPRRQFFLRAPDKQSVAREFPSASGREQANP